MYFNFYKFAYLIVTCVKYIVTLHKPRGISCVGRTVTVNGHNHEVAIFRFMAPYHLMGVAFTVIWYYDFLTIIAKNCGIR